MASASSSSSGRGAHGLAARVPRRVHARRRNGRGADRRVRAGQTAKHGFGELPGVRAVQLTSQGVFSGCFFRRVRRSPECRCA